MSSSPVSEPASAPAPPPLRDAIFISYRRDDARGASGRVYDWLKIGFGAGAVFRDVHSIGVGRWRDRIDAALARCAACVAVIGPRWADATNLPRLHESGDMVRHELVTALASEAITMVPTLVENAPLPGGELVEQLPEPLQPLFREWNIRMITENGWEDDIRRLIQEIGEATALPVQPDFHSLLLSVAAAEQRIAGLEQEHRAQRDQLEASQRTIAELRGRLAEAPSGERDRLSEAFAALAQGNTRQAEAVFEREHAAALRTAVDAACHVGNLALLRDVGKAATYFGKALELDPVQPEALLQLSQARVSLGDLDGAEQALHRGLELARAKGDGRLELRALLGLGDGQLARGDGGAALTHNRQAVAIATALADQQPADPDRQRDLSVAHTKVGDALLAQGPEAALESYRHSLAIRQKLAAQEPASSQAQRDLAIGLERIGEILLWQKDFDGAVDTSRRSLAIRDALVERDSGNSNAQLDLSIGHNKVGDALLARGDGGSALAAYTKALRIMEELVRADPGNSQWQRELAFCHNRRGEELAAAGESEEALLAFRQGQAVAERLACLDPDNSLWQADLAIVFDRIGAAVQHQGDLDVALQHYQRALAIRSALVACDPETSPWLRDLFVSHLNVADSLTAQNNPEAARLSCRKALAIADQLLACAPDDRQTRFDRAEAGYKLSAAIAADPGSLSAAGAELLNTSREVVADLRASGWQMPDEAWLRAMEAEQGEPGADIDSSV